MKRRLYKENPLPIRESTMESFEQRAKKVMELMKSVTETIKVELKNEDQRNNKRV
jgi:hypothetical protein